jgi:hypothetical protein
MEEEEAALDWEEDWWWWEGMWGAWLLVLLVPLVVLPVASKGANVGRSVGGCLFCVCVCGGGGWLGYLMSLINAIMTSHTDTHTHTHTHAYIHTPHTTHLPTTSSSSSSSTAALPQIIEAEGGIGEASNEVPTTGVEPPALKTLFCGVVVWCFVDLLNAC